jgi:hypothetical protein
MHWLDPEQGAAANAKQILLALAMISKLNVGYVVEDSKVHHLQKELPHLVGWITGNAVINLGQQCRSQEQRMMAIASRRGRSLRGWGGRGEVAYLYRRESRVCFGF